MVKKAGWRLCGVMVGCRKTETLVPKKSSVSRCVATLSERGTVHALAVLPDGRLASGSWDHTIKVWK